MEFLLALLITVGLVAIVVVAAIYIYNWMAPNDPWATIIRIIMGLIALVVLVGFITGKIPLIKVPF